MSPHSKSLHIVDRADCPEAAPHHYHPHPGRLYCLLCHGVGQKARDVHQREVEDRQICCDYYCCAVEYQETVEGQETNVVECPTS